jgi:glycosyltransferase involved in cell wall biosynthesis
VTSFEKEIQSPEMDKNRPILWMIDGLGPGGAEQLMPSILKTLAIAGYKIRICALQIKHENPIAGDLERLGLPVDLLLIPNLRHPFNLFRILRYLQFHRPQILHTQLEFSDILGGVAARILRIPVVSTLHTLDTSEEPGRKTATWRLKLRWSVLRKLTDRVIAVSQKTRSHHIQVAGIDASKIITIYNGIDLVKFNKPAQERHGIIKQGFGIPPDRKVIITVAVLRELKGIQFMIQSLPAIRNRIPNVHYLIVGEGNYKTQLLQLVASLDIEDNVTFAGHRTDIPALLHCSDLFVLPTLIDALPTVLIEALAAGIPIVASDVGGIPEIVKDTVNGLLVPAGDPIGLAEACVRILENQSLSDKLVSFGAQVAQERFNIKVQADQLIKCYEELLASYEK